MLQRLYAFTAAIVAASSANLCSAQAADISSGSSIAPASHALETDGAIGGLGATGLPGLGQGAEQILDRFRISTGHYVFDKAPYSGESHTGSFKSVAFDLSRAKVGSPVSLSGYADFGEKSSSLSEGASHDRKLRGYGVNLNFYLPGSLTKIIHPYAGIGLGQYKLTDNFEGGTTLSNSVDTSKTGFGGKALVGVELANYVYLEASYTRPGLSSLNGKQLCIGTRL